MVDVMVDIETLAEECGAIIVSIGAVKFHIDKDGAHITDKFSVNIDPKSGKEAGLVVSQSTLDWWARQPAAVSRAWRIDPVPMREAFEKFNTWWGGEHNAWCQGTNFDFPILDFAYRKLGMQVPWHFRHLNDMRTVLKLFGMTKAYKELCQADGTYHSALDDCVRQAMFLGNLLKGTK